MKQCLHCGKYDLSKREAAEIAAIHMMAPVTSAEVKKKFRITIQNASNRLRKWQRAGFLSRVETAAPSGGIEHVYEIPKGGQ